jgi:hypothetical protein
MTARATLAAMGLPPREALRFFLQKVNVPTRRWDDIWGEQHSHAFMVAGATSRALLDDFRAEIQVAMERGTSLGEFRQRFEEIVKKHGWAHTGTPGWRAQIIYETNLSSAYSAGRWSQMTEPDTLAVFPYWQYVHSGAEHPRLQHLAWNGLTLRADDPWWRTHYPPNGWRCGCRVRPLSARDLARQGKLGPDRAPPVSLRPYTRSDGRTVMVPQGIDPGFAHNPGEAQRGYQNAIPSDAVLRPPPGWPPPAPVVGAPAGAAGKAMPAALRPIVRREGVPEQLRRADEAARQLFAQWRASLSEEERGVIGRYRLKGRVWNAALRDGDPLPKTVLREIELLKAALARSVVTSRLVVRRGAGEAELDVWGDSQARSRTRSFVSASIDAATAAAFARRAGGRVIEIRIPAGTRGAAYIHGIPASRPRQFELLLAPGLRYRVVSRSRRRLVVELLP